MEFDLFVLRIWTFGFFSHFSLEFINANFYANSMEILMTNFKKKTKQNKKFNINIAYVI